MTEIIFLVESDFDGGYIAQALGESIITQADDIETLKGKIKDAVHCHFPDETYCNALFVNEKNIENKILS